MATLEVPPGNPAIGLLRENIITGFFLSEFGNGRIQTAHGGVNRGFDISVCGQPLSIKTVKNNGGVKVLWTIDPLKVGLEIARDYKPEHDIFLVNVFWNECRDSIFYIPATVQSEIHDEMKDGYLKASVGTNHRGISISSQAMKALKQDNRIPCSFSKDPRHGQ